MTEYFLGIDIGSWSTKAVLVDGQKRVAGKCLHRSGVELRKVAEECRDEALRQAGATLNDLKRTVATGFGRDAVSADGVRTEISCHARGAFHHFPKEITVIDIGGQDNKVIRVSPRGKHISFKMNRKCAAGTGSFLEEIALRLALPVSDLNGLAERSTREVTLGSFCTVFTATEILEKIRSGQKVEDIVKGAFRSVVKRIIEMDTVDGALVMTGGVVAHNPMLVGLVEEAFGTQVLVPPEPQYTGAFGAALFALEQAERGERTCS